MKPTILIIDDDEKLNQLLRDFLGDFGFDTLSATHPAKGLQLVKKKNYLNLFSPWILFRTNPKFYHKFVWGVLNILSQIATKLRSGQREIRNSNLLWFLVSIEFWTDFDSNDLAKYWFWSLIRKVNFSLILGFVIINWLKTDFLLFV